MKVIYLTAFILTLGFASCTTETIRDNDDLGSVAGYAPVDPCHDSNGLVDLHELLLWY